MSHPGLVVSEGSAVFSSTRAAGLTGEHRVCCFDGCLCVSRVVGGRAVDTLHISKARSVEEMKIDAEKWPSNSSPIRYIYYHLHICDTFVSVFLYIHMHDPKRHTHSHVCVCVASSVIRAM